MQITVSENLLHAADRLYDAVDETIRVLGTSPPHRLLLLDALQARLQRAKADYDNAVDDQEREVDRGAA